MTATSGRQLRSCEGRIEIHQAITPKKSTMANTNMRRWRENQSAQIANAAKATANPIRPPAHGKFE
jgi:hypothetical protein